MTAAPVAACLVDLDGTLYVEGAPVPGAADAVAALRRAGIPLAFATNTTRRPRSALVERLGRMGIELDAGELLTAPVAAVRWLAAEGVESVSLLLPAQTHEEFAGFRAEDERPDAVVVGDLGEGWTYGVLNRAFFALRRGARLLAVHRNRAWNPGDGMRMDAGGFVAALEYAAEVEAVLVGKPSPAFFAAAAGALGVPLPAVAVVGDGVDTDVAGAQAVGATAVAVRTGVFRQDAAARLPRPPDAVLDSVADLPRWLGL